MILYEPKSLNQLLSLFLPLFPTFPCSPRVTFESKMCYIFFYNFEIKFIKDMHRNSSKLSFWVIRPTQNKDTINIQLPLLHRPTKEYLSNEYAHQIHSLTNEYRAKQKLTLFNQILKRYGEWMDRYQVVIHPESYLLLYWNYLIFITIFANFIEIPVVLLIAEDSYYQIYRNHIYSLFYYLVLGLLIYDMLIIRPRVRYEINGLHLTKNQEILRYYLSNFFIIDLVGILVIIVSYLPINHIDYLRFVFFLKIVTLKEINRQIKFKLLIKRYSSAIYEFLKLIFLIMFVTNFYACIYFAIDFHYYQLGGEFYEKGYLWINGSFFLYNIDVQQTFGRVGSYIYALYWSLETASTCGYGIATPKNYVSMFFANFVMLSIEVVFFYFTNGVIDLIIAHNELRREKFNKIKKVVDVSNLLQIQSQTKNKLIEYISDLRNSQMEAVEEYMQLSLSQALQNQFKLTFNHHFINLIELISLISLENDSSLLFKIDVANIIKHKQYQKNDILYKCKEIQEESLFLIERGVCVIQNPELGYRKYESQWTVIGKREFYFEKMPVYTIFAKEYLEGLKVDRKEFMSCLKKYRFLYEKYREIVDGIVINKHESNSFHLKCIFCYGSHLHQHCSMTNNWRMELRIRDFDKKPCTHHSRSEYLRKQVKSHKLKSFKLETFQVDCIFRSKEYLKTYNI